MAIKKQQKNFTIKSLLFPTSITSNLALQLEGPG